MSGINEYRKVVEEAKRLGVSEDQFNTFLKQAVVSEAPVPSDILQQMFDDDQPPALIDIHDIQYASYVHDDFVINDSIEASPAGIINPVVNLKRKASSSSLVVGVRATKRNNNKSGQKSLTKDAGELQATEVPAKSEVLITVPKIFDSLPLPTGAPAIHSKTRRGLISVTYEFYNSTEASWYSKGGKIYGLLIDKDTTPRSCGDVNYIMTRSTGGTTKDPNDPTKRVQAKSQNERHTTVDGIKQAFKDHTTIVVIAGDETQLLPVVMPHAYQILDYYWVSDYWEEMTNGFSTFRVRLQRCHLDRAPWYQPAGVEYQPPELETFCYRASCSDCENIFPQIYQEWMCLNSKCSSFWKFSDGSTAIEEKLIHNEDFRNHCKKWNGTITKELPTKHVFEATGDDVPQLAFSRAGWRGYWCPQCGECTDRFRWSVWECSACGSQVPAPLPILTVEQASSRIDKESFKVIPYKPFRINSQVSPTELEMGSYTRYMFPVLSGRGSIELLRPLPGVNAQKGGADDLFRQLQASQEMNLTRRPKFDNQSKRASNTCNFTQNFGHPYVYKVLQDSTPFSATPEIILRLVNILNKAGEATGMDGGKPFNEVLVVAYMENQHMGWHNDGEKNLGDTIATMSLGGPALMKFKYGDKEYYPPYDFKKDKFKKESMVFSGVVLEEERKLMIEWIAKNPEASEAAILAKWKSYARVQEFLQMKVPRWPNRKSHVETAILHGDILLMHGEAVQDDLQHSVDVKGVVRYAITCRHIKEESIDPANRHMGEFDTSAFPEYTGFKINTSGSNVETPKSEPKQSLRTPATATRRGRKPLKK